jgi:type II secretory ATPase GspE/PulE/Tfp pilus assembly ATPase PilB-like protein
MARPDASAPAHPAPAWADSWLMEAFRRRGDARAEAAARLSAASAWEALVAAGVPDGEVADTASFVSRLPRAPMTAVAADAGAMLVPALAARYGIVPIGAAADGALEVASSNPFAAGLEEDVAFSAGRRVRLLIASPTEIAAAAARLYPEAAAETAAAAARESATEVHARLVADALRAGASDLHLEPVAGGALQVRHRVDGSLVDVEVVAPALAPRVVSRLKVMAGLDISDRMRPQDGRTEAELCDRTIDLRISTLPVGDGREKVVVRLLDARQAEAGLATLGFLAPEMHRLERLLRLPEGLVLVTGPTGSGKTTTLYAALAHVRTRERNLVTVEDPVEYRLPGVNQVQVNERAGLTFASALRSILRQDPDVILVGEIRDADTAGIAVKASMTGHLVLSTLHTNDAPSAVSRMLDVGAEPGALSGALKGVVAQRLLRKVCAHCARPATLAELPADQQGWLMGRDTSRLRMAVGCAHCRGTGYRGRMVVAELLLVTEEMQRAVARGASAAEIGEMARAGGMLPMWEAGVERVLAGATTLHELVDNVAPPADAPAASQSDVDALLATLLGGGGPPSPAAAPSPAPAPTAPASPVSTATATPTARPAGGAARTRVLVVDEDRAARAALRAALAADGFGVLEAADGEAALAYARRLRPDVVVTELALPRLDGIGLLQALLGDADGPRVVVYRAGRRRAAGLGTRAGRRGRPGPRGGRARARGPAARGEGRRRMTGGVRRCGSRAERLDGVSGPVSSVPSDWRRRDDERPGWLPPFCAA